MKQKQYLPYKNVHRLMKDNTDLKVKKDSVEQLILFFESMTKNIISLSALYCKYDGRKMISCDDVNLAIKTMFKE